MPRSDGIERTTRDMPMAVLLATLLLAPLAATCEVRPPALTPDLAARAGRGTRLAGTEWLLISLNGEGLIEGTQINLYFEDALLGGSMTCNGYGAGPDSGKYIATEEGTLTLPDPIAVTVQHCATPEGVMEQEAAYVEALQNAATYQVAGERLEIRNASGETILVFARRAEE